MPLSDKELPIAAQFNEIVSEIQLNELQEIERIRQRERDHADALRRATQPGTLSTSQAFLQDDTTPRKTKDETKLLGQLDNLESENRRLEAEAEKEADNARRVEKFPAPVL